MYDVLVFFLTSNCFAFQFYFNFCFPWFLYIYVQVLELGIVVHSVIIGISLGASQSPETIKPLMAALSFHQFFEGTGLGGCIVQVYIVQIFVFLIYI